MDPDKMNMIMSEYNEKLAPMVNTQDEEPVEEATEVELIEE
jgi:hypothetical protein